MSMISLLRAALAALAVLAVAAPQPLAAATHKSSKTASHSTKKTSAKRKSTSSKSRSSRSSRSKVRQVSAPAPKGIDGAMGKVTATASGATTYTVKSGQGLDAVARATGVSKDQLAKLNNLKSPYRLRVGQKLKTGAAQTKGLSYVVAKGDHLSAIARRFDVSVDEIAKANHIKEASALAAGRKLVLPSGAKDTAVIEAEVRAPQVAYARPGDIRQTPIIPGEPTLPPVETPTHTVAPPIDPVQVASAGSGRFIWPLQGRVTQPFGAHTEDKADDGIDIEAATGTPVRAAADGQVLFAGRQIAAYGNYVLIQHDGGFFTAYGNLDRLNVRIGQRVTQGEEIGMSGQTGQAVQPQLHFEVLYAARREDKSAPLDPLLVLPKP